MTTGQRPEAAIARRARSDVLPGARLSRGGLYIDLRQVQGDPQKLQ